MIWENKLEFKKKGSSEICETENPETNNLKEDNIKRGREMLEKEAKINCIAVAFMDGDKRKGFFDVELSADGKNVLCKRKGIVEKGFHCRHFDYDPLLRVPRSKAPELPTFDPEEFKI